MTQNELRYARYVGQETCVSTLFISLCGLNHPDVVLIWKGRGNNDGMESPVMSIKMLEILKQG